jgi:hypothetical protein
MEVFDGMFCHLCMSQSSSNILDLAPDLLIQTLADPDNEIFDSVINSWPPLMMVCNFVLCISIITLIHSDYSKDDTPQHYSTCMQSTINIEGLLGFFKNSCLQKM